MFAGDMMFAGSGTGNFKAISGIIAMRPGNGPARQVTLKRVATAPAATGVAVSLAQV